MWVKYTCDTCGSWAQNNVPALTLSAFTLDPAYLSATTTGVEYSGNAYTVVYNVAPAFHRYVGTTLDNHVSVTAPGSYGIIITVDSAIYDNVELRTAERLLVYPKSVDGRVDGVGASGHGPGDGGGGVHRQLPALHLPGVSVSGLY